MVTEAKGRKEAFATFFEEPSRVALRDLLSQHEGEFKNYDFKGTWPDYADVARHILGFANSGGGCLVVGVAEQDDGTLDTVGLAALVDKADIQKGVQKYLPHKLQEQVSVHDFSYKETEYAAIKGKKFQVLLVQDAPQYLPFVSPADGGPGGKSLRKAAIYVRRGASTEEANYEELQEILNRRLETQISTEQEFTLDSHLAELKSLYKQISPHTFISLADRISEFGLTRIRNSNYPKEDFDGFIARLITQKKREIEKFMAARRKQ